MGGRSREEDGGGRSLVTDAADLVAELTRRGLTIAVAESLTGGLLVAELIAVPGASLVVRGGVVAYATDLKEELLGVDAALLAASGPIHPDVARQMADGVRRRLGADIGISTTGAAGPGPGETEMLHARMSAACTVSTMPAGAGSRCWIISATTTQT